MWFFLKAIPFKFWLYLFAVLSLMGAFYWFRHSIYQECQSDARAAQDSQTVKALQLELEQAKQKEAFLLDNQRKNEDFIKRQKKALKDAKEQDGDVAPVMRGTLERLRSDRTD